MEPLEDLVTEMEKTESQDRRRFVVTSIELRTSVATSLESQSPREIRRDLLCNRDFFDEIRHGLKSEDRDADEIPVHPAVVIPASAPSLFLY
ncbi:hypothetical protein TIFTF001_017006 [Ficus carica]|uniref:Uncharacterized protein n=1 Tax=Ficus carica TaxID=3494 RepID=A0AA88A8H1_FICCA|nr:hypothetical protein TIFTF001_017006 [Ficus carica]